MAIQKREVEYAKEIDDIAVLVNKLIRDARDKKPLADIISSSVQPLVDALAGVDQIPAEVRANRKVALQTIGYRSGEMADAILGAPDPVPQQL